MKVTIENRAQSAKSSAPLSFQQQGLWFLQRLDPGNCSYNESIIYRLTGHLDRRALQRAIEALSERHHILRTIYPEIDGVAYQRVREAATLRIDDFSYENTSGAIAARVAAMTAIRARNASSFDLNHDMPIRVGLHAIDAEEHWLHASMHHIATDGWSWPIFMRELAALYSAFASGAEPALLPPAIQYADFAARQRAEQTKAALAPALQFWRQRLAGAPDLQAFADRPRPPVRTNRGAGEPVSLPADLYRRCKDFARSQHATLFVVLLSAFKLLLARRSGQDDVVVGTPVSNRNIIEIESAIGLFVNTVATRTDLSPAVSFSDLVRRVRDGWLSSVQYQDLPFEKLVDDLRPERDLSRNPIFQTMFSYQRAQPYVGAAAGLSFEPVEAGPSGSRFDLELSLRETSAGIDGTLIYDTDLFDAATAARFAADYLALLDGAVRDPVAPLDGLDTLCDADRRQLEAWNATTRDYPDCTVHEWFERQAHATPDRIAIEQDDLSLSYGDLNGAANRLAACLRRRGLVHGNVVAVCMERSCDLVVAALATLKAGGVYMPIDVAHPRARRDFMLSDSAARFLITSGAGEGFDPASPIERFDLETRADEMASEVAQDAPSGVTADDAMYVVYTSGSTGTPNGVLGLHRGMVNRLAWMQRTYPIAANETACLKTRVGFVDSIAEMFGPLIAGASLVILDEACVQDPRVFIAALSRHRISRIVLVPTLLRAMLETEADISDQLVDFQLWVCSGEALNADLAELFHRRLPGSTLLNLYGSSEVSADATAAEIAPGRGVVIGKPIDNIRVHVLDDQRRPVPIGAPGDIFIGGDGLARGYLNRPDLESERFLVDESLGRLFRTGDRGRRRADGDLEFLGRVDGQIKLRGVRIELGEVESALRDLEGVADAVVLAMPTGSAPEYLIAFVRATGPDRPTPRSLLALLRERLPASSVPRQIEWMDAFPQTSSGKIDKRALADRRESDAPGLVAQEPPSIDETQSRLAEIWREVLGVKRLDVFDSFFDLGGHSLLAVRLLVRIEQTFDICLPLTALFQAPSVALMCARLRREAVPGDAFLLVSHRAAPDAVPLFCLNGLFLYRPLAEALAGVAPVYGVYIEDEIKRFDELVAGGAHLLDHLAVRYVEKIRAMRPQGPYRLAGLSRGGLVAIEAARLLAAQGEVVSFVGLLDTNAPRSVRRSWSERLRDWTKAAAAAAIDQDAITTRLYQEAWRRLCDAPYRGDVVVFRAGTSNWGARPEDLGWRRFVDGAVQVHEVAGDHLGILKSPNAAELGTRMEGYLR